MSDVTHYARARKWLDDPATAMPDEVRADLNAALAVSTAQRETEKTLGRMVERTERLTAGVTQGLGALQYPRMVKLGNAMVDPRAITHLLPDPDRPDGVIVHIAGYLLYVDDCTVEQVAEEMGL